MGCICQCSLCYFWEMVEEICEFDVVEFDVGSWLARERVMGLDSTFDEKNV